MTFLTEGGWDFSGADAMFERIKGLLSQSKSLTAFVMTNKTLDKINLEVSDKARDRGEPYTADTLSYLCGIPIEAYPTIRECIARVVNSGIDERLQLIIEDGTPSEMIEGMFCESKILSAGTFSPPDPYRFTCRY